VQQQDGRRSRQAGEVVRETCCSSSDLSMMQVME
jgi:hypothetical protein